MLKNWLGAKLILTMTLAFAMGPFAFAQSANSLSPEALSAKSLLEDLIVKRFSQGLSTKLEKDAYSIGAQLDLSNKPIDPEKNSYEVIDDLALGAIDPESLMKKFSGSSANEMAATLLKQYSISSVQISVGLAPQLGEEKKKEIQTWLEARLKKEFGPKAKGEVTFIDRAPTAEAHKTFLDHLRTFQDLAGQAVLAFALLVGALLWGLLASKNAAAKDGGSQSINVSGGGSEAGKEGLPQNSSLAIEKRRKEEDVLAKEISVITGKLVDLLPKVADNFENVLRSWCQQGEAGRIRLVCFAEAVGKEVGKLPIPVDALPDITKVFSQMPHMNLKEKRDALDKSYWDLLAVMNLGVEALNQPFSYIGGLNVDTINEVLIEQNPKMRTLVALYMPEDLRNKYLGSLNEETKLQLLQSATDLNEIPISEFNEFDASLSSKVKNRGKGSGGAIQLEMTLQKVVSGLNAIEKLTMLNTLNGAGLDLYKKMIPSLAFLNEWPDEALSKLIERSNVDEMLALIRIRADYKDKLISLSPPMTAEMVKDELGREDLTNKNDKMRLINNLEQRVSDLVAQKEVDLETIFSKPSESTKANLRSVA